MKESKEDRFCRVAKARVNKIIKMMRLLGNCSNNAVYAFSPEQVEQIFETLQFELRQARKQYIQTTKSDFLYLMIVLLKTIPVWSCFCRTEPV